MFWCFDLVLHYGKSWTSACSGLTYPLKWTLVFRNNEGLYARSVRSDQEIRGQGSAAHEGFTELSATVLGSDASFAMMELVDFRVSPPPGWGIGLAPMVSKVRAK